MIAVFQHGTGNLALFLHVLGATVLFGALLVFVALVLLGRRRPERRRLLFRTWLFLVLPAYIAMRVGAEWIYSREKKDLPGLDDAGWIGTGYIVADAGAVLLLVVGISAFFAARREGRGRAALVAGGISAIYLAALAVAMFVMSTKHPT